MTGWIALALLAAAGSAALFVDCGPSVVRRRVDGPRSIPSARRRTRWTTWTEPRADAEPLRRRIVVSALIAAAAATALGSFGRAPWWVLVVLAVGVATGLTLGLGRVPSAASRRESARLLADLPQCWELLAAGLSAGLPVRTALAEVTASSDGALRVELDRVLTRIRLGEPEEQAWRSIGDHPLLGQPARDLARSVASGTGVVELLVAYAAQAREDRHAAAEADAKAIGVRAVLPLMLCFLPAFFLIGVVPIIAGTLIPLIAGW